MPEQVARVSRAKRLHVGIAARATSSVGDAGEVLSHEPCLQLIGANEITHDDVVGAVVAMFGGRGRQRARFVQQELVSIEQAFELLGRRLRASWHARNAAFLHHVVRRRQRDAAEQLHSLGQRVD